MLGMAFYERVDFAMNRSHNLPVAKHTWNV